MSLASDLRDKCIAIIGACDDLTEEVKQLPELDRARFAAVRMQVAGLRSLALRGQVVTAAMLAPVREPEECHVYAQEAPKRQHLAPLHHLSGKDRAAGEHDEPEEVNA